MKLLNRSTLVAVVVAGVVAGVVASSTSAFAIVGGQSATQDYPGTAALSIVFPRLGTAACGGGLISPRFVLTAAHCVSDQDAAPTPIAVPGSTITVRAGSNDRTSGGVVATGTRVYLHPDWMWGQPTGKPVSDLALVELDRDIRDVRLLPVGLRTPTGVDPVRLIGWGLTAFPPPPGATLPTLLHQRDTTRQPVTSCQGGFIGAGESCFGGGACFGDSGSPALHRINGHLIRTSWVSVGVASRETSEQDPCAQPTVYTDPSYPPFRVWIFTTILHRQVLPCTCAPVPAAATPVSVTMLNTLKLKITR
jgi:secreted trypsin-like serine protease